MVGASVGASGSFSASKINISSDYASVADQSVLKTGAVGFQVNVKGDTALIGGAIASNQKEPIAGAVAFGATAVGVVADTANYLASP